MNILNMINGISTVDSISTKCTMSFKAKPTQNVWYWLVESPTDMYRASKNK